MRPSRVLRSGAFRLALIFAAIFAVAAVLLAAGVDAAVKAYAERTTMQALSEETERVRAKGVARGPNGLAAFIRRREQTTQAEHFRYLLLAPDGRRLAGSLPLGVAKTGASSAVLPHLPEADEGPDDDDGGAPETDSVRTRGFRLSDGSLAVVGRDAFAMEDLTRWVDRLTLWSGVGVVLLALLGGYVLAALFVRRLERVNAAAERIMAGHLNERLPTIGAGDEFRRLSASLNAMLDRIEALMGNLRQVSTDIAHDLRTPLTRIRATLDSVPTGAPAHVQRRAHEDAGEQLDQLLATFSALLRIGQLEGGVGRARFGRVDLSEVLQRVVQAYRPAAEDAGKTLTGSIEADVTVHGDTELLAQLFANLIENALTHAGPVASIKASLARSEGGSAVASIADDGPGIPAEEREKVVRRFYRLDASRSTPGAGLGLALASAIADLHGLKLRLSDNGPGLRVTIVFAPTQRADAEQVLRKPERSSS